MAISIAVVEVVLRGKGDGRVVAEVIGAVHGMHGMHETRSTCGKLWSLLEIRRT